MEGWEEQARRERDAHQVVCSAQVRRMRAIVSAAVEQVTTSISTAISTTSAVSMATSVPGPARYRRQPVQEQAHR